MWVVVFLLIGFWGLGFTNGYSFGGLIHILLVYAGLMVAARLLERRRRRTGESIPPREPVEPLGAERERRAKIVNAEGEFQAAEKMVQAPALISKEPIALQFRFLQTMREISSEHNTTTFLPVPVGLFSPFLKGAPKA